MSNKEKVLPDGWVYFPADKLSPYISLDAIYILLAIMTCFFVWMKKKSIRNIWVNASFSRISD